MNIVLAHSIADELTAIQIARWLHSRSLTVDLWELEMSESLVMRLQLAEQPVDRLIVALSPIAVLTGWLRREVATGQIDHLPPAPRSGAPFVIPVLLKACAVPARLRDQIAADFVADPFDDTCTRLYSALLPGIIPAPAFVRQPVPALV